MRIALPITISLLAGAALAGPAQARVVSGVQPYIELQQVLDADLKNGGDVLTYTSVAAGVDAGIRTQRIETTVSYRYERRFAWNDDLADDEVHSGLARINYTAIPELLTIEAGALATRARTDIRGGAPVFLTGDNRNVSDVFAAYAGPNLRGEIGAMNWAAGYRLGYVKVRDGLGVDLPPGQRPLDRYDDSTSHTAYASIGMETGILPFGWSVAAGYEREDASQLDQRYEALYVRGDVTVPVSYTVALTAGVGYEDLQSSQRAPLLGADGFPVLNGNGGFVTDPASPRLLAYDENGLIYDAGVIWKPNRRTTLEARIGKRYGATAITGLLSWQTGPQSALNITVYNAVDSFGRSLNRNLSGLPASFNVPRNGLTNRFGGCVFGSNPGAGGTGGCFNDSFQSITTANYRSRGVTALYSARIHGWEVGIGGGYAERRYLSPLFQTIFAQDGVKDSSITLQGTLARQLAPRTSLENAVYVDFYDPGIPGAADVTSAGATSALFHNFTDRLTGNATVGLYAFDQEGFESDLSGQLLLGMRYQF